MKAIIFALLSVCSIITLATILMLYTETNVRLLNLTLAIGNSILLSVKLLCGTAF